MKTVSIALAVILGSCGITLAQTPAAHICLDAGHIDHTVVADGHTILFYMRGGKVWKNTLPQDCPGLKFERAFSEDVTGDVICSNMQMIRVLHTGAVCSLGPFTPQPAK